MLIRKEEIGKNGLLGIWHIGESKEEFSLLFPSWLRQLSVEETASFSSEARIKEWYATRYLLFLLTESRQNIVYSREGKPYLTDNSWQISLSHTKDYAAVLIHKSFPVGIDIETISPRVNLLADKFISTEEFVDNTKATIHRLLHWSAKETLFKLLDENPTRFKEELIIQPFAPKTNGTMKIEFRKPDFAKPLIYDIAYEVHNDYVLTWSIDYYHFLNNKPLGTP